jgi:hypothetical protein
MNSKFIKNLKTLNFSSIYEKNSNVFRVLVVPQERGNNSF